MFIYTSAKYKTTTWDDTVVNGEQLGDIPYFTIKKDDNEFTITFMYKWSEYVILFYDEGCGYYVHNDNLNTHLDETIVCDYFNGLNISPQTIMDNSADGDIKEILDDLLQRLVDIYKLEMEYINMFKDNVRRIMGFTNMKRAE